MRVLLQMHFLVCAATAFEIQPTLDATLNAEDGVDFLITGVGLTASTFSVAKKVLGNRPDFIIQAGVAGSLNPDLSNVSVVVVQSEMIGDEGVSEDGHFKSLQDLKLLEPNASPWIDGKLKNPATDLEKYNLRIADAVSINEITTQAERIKQYQSKGAQLESMEGAALHYVAISEGIPFLQLRAISNRVGERDKSKWKMKEAIAALNVELQRIIKELR